jgi:hypothetical protein
MKMKLLHYVKRYLPGAIIGAGAGWLYWRFFGCDGSCMISSSPWRSSIYFAFLGGLVVDLILPAQKASTADKKEG